MLFGFLQLLSRAFQYRKPRGQQHGRLRAGIAAELRATGAPWLQSKPRRCRFIGTPCDCRRGRAKSYATTASFWTNERSFQSVAYRDPDVLGWCHRTIRLAIPVHQRFVQTRPPVPRPRPAWAWTLTSPEGMTNGSCKVHSCTSDATQLPLWLLTSGRPQTQLRATQSARL